MVLGNPGSGKTRLVKTLVKETGCIVRHDPYGDFDDCNPNPDVIVIEEIALMIDLSSHKRTDLDMKYELFKEATQVRHLHQTTFIITQDRGIYSRFDALPHVTIKLTRVPREYWFPLVGTVARLHGFGCCQEWFITNDELLGSKN